MKNSTKAVTLSVGIAIVTFLLLSSAMVFLLNTLAYTGTAHSTRAYVRLHEKEIKQEIFQQLFVEAEVCSHIQEGDSKNSCVNYIRTRLGEIIVESDFSESPYVQDLFFVKEHEDNVKKLGWDGELVDITSSVNRQWLHSPLPYSLQISSRECVYFGLVFNEKYACEWYQKIALDYGDTGYIVRFIPITEEMDFTFALFLPSLWVQSLSQLDFSYPALFYYGFGVVPLLTGIMAYKYLKRTS